MNPFLIFLIIIVVIIFFVVKTSKRNKLIKQEFLLQGYDIEHIIYTSNYISGHPDIDKGGKSFLIKKGDEIKIYFGFITQDKNKTFTTKPEFKASIPIANIKNVLAEDKSTIQSRLSYTKIAFGIGLNEKHKTERAFLVIEWNDGKFDHETVFDFEDKNAMQKANIGRNQLIKIIR